MMTGVAKGARMLSMYYWSGRRAFVECIKFVVQGKLDRLIALICAQGLRSTDAQKALLAAGFTNVQNIRESMFGSTHGPGWFKAACP